MKELSSQVLGDLSYALLQRLRTAGDELMSYIYLTF